MTPQKIHSHAKYTKKTTSEPNREQARLARSSLGLTRSHLEHPLQPVPRGAQVSRVSPTRTADARTSGQLRSCCLPGGLCCTGPGLFEHNREQREHILRQTLACRACSISTSQHRGHVKFQAPGASTAKPLNLTQATPRKDTSKRAEKIALHFLPPRLPARSLGSFFATSHTLTHTKQVDYLFFL